MIGLAYIQSGAGIDAADARTANTLCGKSDLYRVPVFGVQTEQKAEAGKRLQPAQQVAVSRTG